MRSARLLAVAILILGLMILSPADAVKGSYPGRNGKIAFTAYDPTYGDSEIYVMNPDGTGKQNLTNNHGVADYGPAWSPDGTKIAFVREFECGQSEDCRRIFVMNADGTGQRQLTFESPENHNIFHYSPAWSPDGTKIAYTRLDQVGGSGGIFVIGPDEAGLGSQLIPSGYDAHWSPDGTEIAFSGAGIKVADANTGAVIDTLTDTGIMPCWSPDGSQIVFVRDDAVWVMKVDGSEQRQLTTVDEFIEDFYPNWSPDGRKIIFWHRADPNWAVFIMNADGPGELTNLTPDGAGSGHDWQRLPPSASPVGGEVASVNMLVVLAPWLAVIGIVGCMTIVVVVTKKRRS